MLRLNQYLIKLINFYIFVIFSVCVNFSATNNGYSNKQSYQLFRENLLPNLGGKIPETAFQPERIALNRLNQNGLFSPDGVYLQQRETSHLQERHSLPKTIQIKPPYENTRALNEGLIHMQRLVDTTYVIREPVIINLTPISKRYSPTFPYSSLKLLSWHRRKHKHHSIPRHSSTWEKDVFNELVPYLKKLHEYD